MGLAKMTLGLFCGLSVFWHLLLIAVDSRWMMYQLPFVLSDVSALMLQLGRYEMDDRSYRWI